MINERTKIILRTAEIATLAVECGKDQKDIDGLLLLGLYCADIQWTGEVFEKTPNRIDFPLGQEGELGFALAMDEHQEGLRMIEKQEAAIKTRIIPCLMCGEKYKEMPKVTDNMTNQDLERYRKELFLYLCEVTEPQICRQCGEFASAEYETHMGEDSSWMEELLKPRY